MKNKTLRTALTFFLILFCCLPHIGFSQVEDNYTDEEREQILATRLKYDNYKAKLRDQFCAPPNCRVKNIPLLAGLIAVGNAHSLIEEGHIKDSEAKRTILRKEFAKVRLNLQKGAYSEYEPALPKLVKELGGGMQATSTLFSVAGPMSALAATGVVVSYAGTKYEELLFSGKFTEDTKFSASHAWNGAENFTAILSQDSVFEEEFEFYLAQDDNSFKESLADVSGVVKELRDDQEKKQIISDVKKAKSDVEKSDKALELAQRQNAEIRRKVKEIEDRLKKEKDITNKERQLLEMEQAHGLFSASVNFIGQVLILGDGHPSKAKRDVIAVSQAFVAINDSRINFHRNILQAEKTAAELGAMQGQQHLNTMTNIAAATMTLNVTATAFSLVGILTSNNQSIEQTISKQISDLSKQVAEMHTDLISRLDHLDKKISKMWEDIALSLASGKRETKESVAGVKEKVEKVEQLLGLYVSKLDARLVGIESQPTLRKIVELQKEKDKSKKAELLQKELAVAILQMKSSHLPLEYSSFSPESFRLREGRSEVLQLPNLSWKTVEVALSTKDLYQRHEEGNTNLTHWALLNIGNSSTANFYASEPTHPTSYKHSYRMDKWIDLVEALKSIDANPTLKDVLNADLAKELVPAVTVADQQEQLVAQMFPNPKASFSGAMNLYKQLAAKAIESIGAIAQDRARERTRGVWDFSVKPTELSTWTEKYRWAPNDLKKQVGHSDTISPCSAKEFGVGEEKVSHGLSPATRTPDGSYSSDTVIGRKLKNIPDEHFQALMGPELLLLKALNVIEIQECLRIEHLSRYFGNGARNPDNDGLHFRYYVFLYLKNDNPVTQYLGKHYSEFKDGMYMELVHPATISNLTGYNSDWLAAWEKEFRLAMINRQPSPEFFTEKRKYFQSVVQGVYAYMNHLALSETYSLSKRLEKAENSDPSEIELLQILKSMTMLKSVIREVAQRNFYYTWLSQNASLPIFFARGGLLIDLENFSERTLLAGTADEKTGRKVEDFSGYLTETFVGNSDLAKKQIEMVFKETTKPSFDDQIEFRRLWLDDFIARINK